MYVNNEIGVIQDIGAIGALCRDRGVAFHTDAAQAAGKIPVDVRKLPIDFLSFNAHKIYGPKGVGALYTRRASRSLLQPVSFGGGQERGLRPGTLATHQIVGFGAACELAAASLDAEMARLTSFRERLWEGLAELGGAHLNGSEAPRAPGILNVSFEGVEGESLVTGLSGPGYFHRFGVQFGLGGAVLCPEGLRPGHPARAKLAALQRRTPHASPPTSISLSTQCGAKSRDCARCRQHRSPRCRARKASATDAPASRSGQGAFVLTAEAGDPGEETWVRFHLTVEAGIVKAARFKAYGCPHTLAVMDWLTRRLPGRARNDGPPGTPAGWTEELSVPVEKLGRLLVIEDALLACFARWPSGA